MTVVKLIDQNNNVLLDDVDKASHANSKPYDNKVIISATYTFVDNIIVSNIDWGDIRPNDVAELTIKIQL